MGIAAIELAPSTTERRGSGERPEIGHVRVCMLGDLVVHRADGTRVRAEEFRTSKTRHLLRLLALSPGTPLRAERLIELLWPESPPQRARASLRTAASQLRRTLGCEAVTRVGDGLLLRGAEVDVARFDTSVTEALRCFAERRDDEGLSWSQAAVEVYRGDLAEDEPYLDPLLREQWRLRQRLLDLLIDAAAAGLRLGRSVRAVELAQRATDLDPTCERACRLLMRAYLAMGEPSMSLRAYDRCRHAIADELGVSPSIETQRVLEYLLHVDDEVAVPSYGVVA